MDVSESGVKVIFTSLGPERAYTDKFGEEHLDGDVAILEKEDYDAAVVSSKFAQHWTQDLEDRTKRLVATAEKTRVRIVAKMSAKSKN